MRVIWIPASKFGAPSRRHLISAAHSGESEYDVQIAKGPQYSIRSLPQNAIDRSAVDSYGLSAGSKASECQHIYSNTRIDSKKVHRVQYWTQDNDKVLHMGYVQRLRNNQWDIL
jgi:hypothetical protein